MNAQASKNENKHEPTRDLPTHDGSWFVFSPNYVRAGFLFSSQSNKRHDPFIRDLLFRDSRLTVSRESRISISTAVLLEEASAAQSSTYTSKVSLLNHNRRETQIGHQW